jgi:hypothetical protein
VATPLARIPSSSCNSMISKSMTDEIEAYNDYTIGVYFGLPMQNCLPILAYKIRCENR